MSNLHVLTRVPLVLVLCVLGLGGCADEVVPNVSEGQYRAVIRGGRVDTLRGPARVRRLGGGLVGLELGRRGGTGFSIEIGPEPLRSQVYDVVAAELLEGTRADSLSGTIAFLQIENALFEAVRGSLSVTHVAEGEVHGTFGFEMDGRGVGAPDPVSIRVTGGLRATKE